MENGEAKAKFGIVFLKWELFLFFLFYIFHSPFLTLAAFPFSRQEQREKCELERFYVLERIAAGGAIVNHPAARRAKRTVQASVLRVAKRTGDCFIARPFKLHKLAARHGHAVRAKPLPAGGRDAIGPPRRVENVLDFDFLDFRHGADGPDDLIVDHLQRGAASEGRGDENTGCTAVDFDAFDDAQIDDADRHPWIVDFSEDRPDALVYLGIECRFLHDLIIARMGTNVPLAACPPV